MAFESVLVVDDDFAAVASARAVLNAAGYAVYNAPCGRQAVQRVMARPPDIVITAILMPDGDGIELISAVKGGRPEMPIIAVSDRRLMRELDLFHLATTLGADAVLAKPLEGETLLATVAGLIWAARTTYWSGEPASRCRARSATT